MTGPNRAQDQVVVPRRVDAALRDTMALLEQVRREEQVLVRLQGCLVEFESIRRARTALADRTESEVVEAEHCLDVEADGTACGGWGR